MKSRNAVRPVFKTRINLAIPAGLSAWMVVFLGWSMMANAAPPTAQLVAPDPLDAPIAGPVSLSSGEILAELDKLAVVGRALYIAAHPDDENTRLLAWMVGSRGVRTAYLSLTRGDGGQNLVGAERGDLLGVVRTHELLRARGIDGAEQRFTRAIDFGYSKTPKETLKKWGKNAVLRDVVAVIRRFKPDVIATRFAAKGRNHGHHTASAILAAEAFVAAADPKMFPKQVALWGTWKAHRLLHNKSTWRLKKGADVSMYQQLDVGGYSALRGLSWGEVAALSRTSHKSQGFGSMPTRGPVRELFEVLGGAGAPAGLKAKDPVFEGIDLTWNRYPNTSTIQTAIDATRRSFDPKQPERSIPNMQKVAAALAALPDDNPNKKHKLASIHRLIVATAGLHIDLTAPAPSATPGAKITATLHALARRPIKARILAVRWSAGERPITAAAIQPTVLAHHTLTELETTFQVPDSARFSTPFWLQNQRKPGKNVHRLTPKGVVDLPYVGVANDPPPLSAAIDLEIEGQLLTVWRPLLHRWRDRVRGELTRRVEVLPPVTVTPDAAVVMMPTRTTTITATVRANVDAAETRITLQLPKGWKARPTAQVVPLEKRGDEATVRFELERPKPPTGKRTGKNAGTDVRWIATVAAKPYSLAEHSVKHDHIPNRTVLRPAVIRAVPIAIRTFGTRLAYIPGAADEVAQRLRQVGYEVTEIAVENLQKTRLSDFDAVITGIRAFNVHPRLLQLRQQLFDYAKDGGTVLVQYNTNNRWRRLAHPVGPKPFEIDRGRVTDETAPLRPLAPKHRALLTPNLLTKADFAGWVQERGLYFAKSWDKAYTPLFASADPGEAEERGSTLILSHGEGAFVYTGLSFFRQLPAGVPGAYRLLANLLALKADQR